MILKHGTSASNLPSIYKEGIRPRQGIGNWFRATQAPSLEGFVYLANNYFVAEFHAARTAVLTNSTCAIFDIDVEEDNLYPDENFFCEDTVLYKNDIIEAQSKVINNKNLWKDCLEKRSMVSHKGTISKNKICNLMTFPVEKSVFYTYIKHMPTKDITSFDRGFDVHIHSAEWMRSLKLKGNEVDIIRNLEIVPVPTKNNTVFEVKLFDHETTIVFK